MFKNLHLYRLDPTWQDDAATVEAALAKAPFVPCGATQQKSQGWVPPRGEQHGALLESIGGQWLVKLMTEQRVLPSAVVKRRTEEVAAQIELTTGRAPGKKQLREIKEQVTLELLPLAFTRQSATLVWIDRDQRSLMIDVSSQGRADEVLTTLVKSLDGRLGVSALHTAQSPAVCMAQWLLGGEAPAPFTIERECELKTADEMKSVVRYARHRLDIDEVRGHIQQGKTPTRLALGWQGRVQFTLTESGQLKKLAFEDVVFESTRAGQGASERGEAFDADAAIATGELGQMLPELIDALGGEAQPGQMPALTADPAPVVSTGNTPSVKAQGATHDSAALATSPPWED